jgi:hypothetical protein
LIGKQRYNHFMLGIYTMMLVVFAAGILTWGSLIFFLNGQKPRALWLLLPGLPLSALVNVTIVLPVVYWVASRAGALMQTGGRAPGWFILFLLCFPPMLEEPAKLLPLLLPPVRRLVNSGRSAIWVGLTLGVSFGLGEAAFLAYNIAKAPANAALPATAFASYAFARWVSCLVYGVISAVFLMGIQRGGRRILAGYLSAVALHVFVNAAAILTQIGVLPESLVQWSFLLDFFLAVLLLIWLLRRTKSQPGGTNLPIDPQNAS